jgi:RimJ/RimL family protein N-acetyltransferase
MTDLHFKFKDLQESDLPDLVEWLSRNHLQEWWRSGEITLEKVREKYIPRIFDKDTAKPYLAYLEEKPFGYIQYYWASEGDSNWWPDSPGTDTIGIDQFIADENNLNQGYGTIMITQFINFLLNNIHVSEIRVDPNPNNIRAIRCYEKIGFLRYGNIKTPDGPALMMILKTELWKKK